MLKSHVEEVMEACESQSKLDPQRPSYLTPCKVVSECDRVVGVMWEMLQPSTSSPGGAPGELLTRFFRHNLHLQACSNIQKTR